MRCKKSGTKPDQLSVSLEYLSGRTKKRQATTNATNHASQPARGDSRAGCPDEEAAAHLAMSSEPSRIKTGIGPG